MEPITGTGKLSRAIRELQQGRNPERLPRTTANTRVQNTTRGTIVDPIGIAKAPPRQAGGRDTWMR